jgi:hypothetical protein
VAKLSHHPFRGSRDVRPRPTGSPAEFSITVWTLAVQASRLAVSEASTGPPSISGATDVAGR